MWCEMSIFFFDERNELDTTLALSSNSYDRIIASSSLQAGSQGKFAKKLVGFYQQT